MGLLQLINTENDKNYISLFEAINLLAKETNSNIYEVATYLLNKDTHILLNSYSRSCDYRIMQSSYGDTIDMTWVGDNDAFGLLKEITEIEKNYSESCIGEYGRYTNLSKSTFWDKQAFFNNESIVSALNYDPNKLIDELDGLIDNTITQNDDADICWIESIEPDYEAWEEIDRYLLEEYELKQKILLPSKQDFNDHKAILFKKPLLSVYESACIMSDTGLYLVLACNDEYDSKITYPNWGGALDYIKTCVKEGLLNTEVSTRDYIKRDDLKKFLASQDIIIDGFNDNLHVQQADIPKINEQQARIEQLENELKKSKSEYEKVDFSLLLEEGLSASLRKEIEDLKSKIQELETQPTIQNDEPDLLALILDETQTDRYAPDLAYSIKLWLDVYVNNLKADSHNNKANTWIKNNTPYNGEQEDTPTRRIREIATPFRDLHPSRRKLLENK